MLLSLIEVVMLGLIVVIGLTQVIVPLIFGKRIFPLFQKSEAAKMREEIKKAQQELELAELRKQLRETQKQANDALVKSYQDTTETDSSASVIISGPDQTKTPPRVNNPKAKN